MSAKPIHIADVKYLSSQKLNWSPSSSKTHNEEYVYRLQIVWQNVFILMVLHAITIYGLVLLFTGNISWKSFVFSYMYVAFKNFGVTGGAHRLWTHRTYKANLPLRIFLMLGQTAAMQNSIYVWARDHRVHHKFTDTNADPHNSTRGFFFSHVGWLMCKKHKDVIEKGKTIDLSDLLEDPVVTFQYKYYVPLFIILTFLLPTWVVWNFFGEPLYISIVMCITRLTLSLNGAWLVNSAAHIWGTKPYDGGIRPTECKPVSVITFGEGWHNYHHIFPWDYKAAELGNYRLNFTTAFIDFMSKIGWAFELKTAPKEMIEKRILRTGDDSWYDLKSLKEKSQSHIDSHHTADMLWGWGDEDMKETCINAISQFNKIKTT